LGFSGQQDARDPAIAKGLFRGPCFEDEIALIFVYVSIRASVTWRQHQQQHSINRPKEEQYESLHTPPRRPDRRNPDRQPRGHHRGLLEAYRARKTKEINSLPVVRRVVWGERDAGSFAKLQEKSKNNKIVLALAQRFV
jgi:hypothetical protein